MAATIKLISKILLIASSLLTLTLRESWSQIVKIGIQGIQRNALFRHEITEAGPLTVSKRVVRFSYGGYIGYEKGANGVELGLYGFPLRTELRHPDLLRIQTEPVILHLFTPSYRRRLLALPKKRVELAAVGSLHVGRYRYEKGTGGGGKIEADGRYIYEGLLNRQTSYRAAMIVLPGAGIDVTFGLSPHVLISYRSMYLFRNLASRKPLESGTYRYTYYGQTGTGTLSDFGAGTLNRLALLYSIQLNHRNLKKVNTLD